MKKDFELPLGRKVLRRSIAAVLAGMMVITAIPGSSIDKVSAVQTTSKTGYIPINEAQFPDPIVLNAATCKDLNGDGYLSEEEIAEVTGLSMYGGTGVHDLAGIECFTSLTSLTVYKLRRQPTSVINFDASVLPYLESLMFDNVDVGNLNISQNSSLQSLSMNYVQGETIDLSGNTELTYLMIGGDDLTELDLSQNKKLTTLYIDHSAIANLDLSNQQELTNLQIENSKNLTDIDLSANTALTSLIMLDNAVKAMDLSNNTILERINLDYVELESLILPQSTTLTSIYMYGADLKEMDCSSAVNLTSLSCISGSLTKLNVTGNTKLENLTCTNNKLTELDLSQNPNLTGLQCSHNQLTELDLSANTNLSSLDCSHNRLAELDLSSNTKLWSVDCSYNWLSELDISANTEIGEYGLDVYHNPMSNVSGDTSDDVEEFDSSDEISIDAEHFPNSGFQELVSRYDTDGNGTLSVLEREAVEEIVVNGSVSDLTGIAYFVNLKVLKIYSCTIDSLNLSGNSELEQLDAAYCGIEALNISGCPNLVYLNCTGNTLETLDVSRCPELETLMCAGNGLHTLNLSANTNLEYLDCTGNVLEGLDFSQNPKLAESYQEQNAFNFKETSTENGVEISSDNFKPYSFYVTVRDELDTNQDGYLSDREISAVHELELNAVRIKSDGDLKGLEYFTGLESLKISPVTYAFDLNWIPQVKYLTIQFAPALQESNELVFTDNPELEALTISGALMGETLDFSGYPNLKTLRVDGSYEKLILPEKPKLTYIYWSSEDVGGGLDTLDLSSCTDLTSLECHFGNDPECERVLNVSGCENLTALNCSNSCLSALDVSNCRNLASLDCRYNNITSLDLTCNIAISRLLTYNNPIHTDTDETFGNCEHRGTFAKASGIRYEESYMEFTCPDCGGIVGKVSSAIVAQGTAGEDCGWYIDGDGEVLHIEGSGALTELAEVEENTQESGSVAANAVSSVLSFFTETVQAEELTLADYLKNVKYIFIEDGITVIGESVFRDCTQAEYVSIPSTVSEIEAYAFEGTKLTKLEIPESVTAIGEGAFAGCTELGTVEIPDSVEKIGTGAFENVTLRGSADSAAEEYAENNSGVSFQLISTELSKTTITLDQDSFVYDGKEHQPKVTVTYKDKVLTEGTDYTISFKGDQTLGTVVMTITGNTAYTGVVVMSYEIVKEHSEIRLAGDTRYETAIVSADELKEVLGVTQFDAVVIASAVNFPDALAGSPLAAQIDAPILLVGSNDASKGQADGTALTIDYINKNLKAGGKIYILGGESAVSTATADKLQKARFEVSRLAGDNRYETDLAIINAMAIPKGTDVVIVRGYTSYKTKTDEKQKKNPQGYADSLSVSGVAGAEGMPIFLAAKNGLTEEQMAKIKEINPEHIYVIGGESAVSGDVYDQISALGVGELKRISGEDRYQTSVAIAKEFRLDQASSAVVAYGQNFPDGLTGGVLAAELHAPLLLAEKGKTQVQKTFITDSRITDLYILGGTAVLPEETISSLVQ